MSYDLIVFDATEAPRERKAFEAWLDLEGQGIGGHLYSSSIPSPSLRAWFEEMIQTFPPLEGVGSSNDPDDPRVTDYGHESRYIVACFGWDQAEAGFREMKRLAAKHRVGFWNISMDNAEPLYPTRGSQLRPTRPWWRLWLRG